MDYEALKTKHISVRENSPENLRLRIHRALSWLGRAEMEKIDADVRFILLWIGFNAAYAASLTEDPIEGRSAFTAFFEKLITLDEEGRIREIVCSRLPHEVGELLSNRFVFAPFWSFHNGNQTHSDWESRLERSKKTTASALQNNDTAKLLSIIFDRLYVLRNQLMHGGATWSGEVNRQQVDDGALVIGELLPVFIDIMIDNPLQDWGKPYYPVVR